MRRVQRRRRRRALAGLLVVVAIVAGGLVTITLLRDDSSAGAAGARRSVQRYLSAWEQGDVARMQRFVTSERGELASTYMEAFAGLSVTRARFEPRTTTVDGDRGEASFTARLELAGLGEWEYRGRLALEHDGTRWLVAWSPAALHPELRPGLRLGTTREVPPRAPILGVDGAPLGGPGAAAADVVGGLGVATAEEAAALGPGYKAGDTIGSSGLQATLERQLAGRPSGAVQLQSASGQVEQTIFRFPGRAPAPVPTTIDPAIQSAAEQALAGTLQPAAVVAVDVATGDVRAVVSRPPGGFARALEGRYPPGSTFKIVTATAALTAGITPQEVIDCPPSVTAGGKVFVNA
ncbi:MAG: penicillin-binding transpeptidase domain-containing protein, partial [Acidimicrobiia bacterium]